MKPSLPPPRLLPPDGINFHCTELVPIDVLVQSLQHVVRFLQDLNPSVQLLRFADWWQHDGLHFYDGEMDMHELFALVDSPRSLFCAMPGDDEVRIGIAPANSVWYLRMYATWTDDGWALAGDFDLTLAARLAFSFRDHVVPNLHTPLAEQNAPDWYGSIMR